MGSLSDQEIQRINKLRENLKDLDLCQEVLNNANLIRFLRAKNFNVKDADEMFRNYIKWFDEMKLESIFNLEIPKAVTEVGIHSFCGFDHHGHPILVCPIGQMDLSKLMNEGYKQQLLLHSVQMLERNAHFVRNLMVERKESDNLILISTISDMEGLTAKQIASPDVIHYFMTQAKIIETYYPETSHKIVVINAPKAFKVLWNIVKPFLSQRTIEKFEVHGKDRQQWEEALLKLAPKESLPKKYGGILPDDVDILPKLQDCVPKKRGSY